MLKWQGVTARLACGGRFPVGARATLGAVLVCFVSLLPAGPASAWTETGQAIADHILSEVLGNPDPLDRHSPYVYVRDYPLSEGDYIIYGSSSAPLEHFAAAGQYLAWIDMHGGARFEHESTIVIVDVVGTQVDSMIFFDTMFPLTLSNVGSEEFVWGDVSAPLGEEFYFPEVTYFSNPDSRAFGDASPGWTARFSDGASSSSLILYGNSEEWNSASTLTEIRRIIADAGIPEGHRVERRYPDGINPTEANLQVAINEAGNLGEGPNLVIFISAHGYNGGTAFNKGPRGTSFPNETILRTICAGLRQTVKRNVLLINGACYSGGMIGALKNLECEDCAGMTFELQTACSATEKALTTRNVIGVFAPWDFTEELEDHHAIWSAGNKTMFVAATEAFAAAALGIDHPEKQHPQRKRVKFKACCKPGRDECVILSEEECAAQGGDWLPDIDECDPNPCPSSAEEATWGAIKALFR